MARKAPVDSSIWTNGKFDEFSPEDKYFLCYLLTNPFLNQLGIFNISVKQAAFQMGYSVDAFKVLLERFENKYGMILFSPETNEIAILNSLRHSVITGGKPVEDCIRQDMAKVKNKELIDAVFSRLYGRDGLNATVKKIVESYVLENGLSISNDNDNDNDNDRSHSVSLDDSCAESSESDQKAPSKPKKKKSVKHKYGDFHNVLLTQEEYTKLEAEFGNLYTLKAIDFLDAYIEEKGYKSKSHNLAIRRWVMDAVKENESKPKRYAGRKEIVPGWMESRLGDAENAAIQKMMQGSTSTIGNNPGLADRAERLRQELQG